MHSMAETEI